MQAMIEIPVTWVDYRIAQSGSGAYLSEEELKDDPAGINGIKGNGFLLIERITPEILESTL